MRFKELKSQPKEQLTQLGVSLELELLRCGTSAPVKSHTRRTLRRNLARVNTVIRQNGYLI